MLITGFEGPITIASAARSASQHLGRRRGLGDPLDLDPLDLGGSTAVDDQVLLQAAPAGRRSCTLVRTGVLAHRQHPRRDPERRGRSGPGRR